MSSPTNTPWKTDRWFVSPWNCSPEVTAGLHFSIKIQFGHGITSTVIAPAAGVEVIQTTVTGVGERVGNVPLEETALSLMTQYGIDLGLGYSKLCELSNFVLESRRSASAKPTGGGQATALGGTRHYHQLSRQLR